jgi:hypothetical protein
MNDQCWLLLFDWKVHWLQVATVEAHASIGRPLSALDKVHVFGLGYDDLGVVSYHQRALVKLGILEEVERFRRRGADETTYRLVAA